MPRANVRPGFRRELVEAMQEAAKVLGLDGIDVFDLVEMGMERRGWSRFGRLGYAQVAAATMIMMLVDRYRAVEAVHEDVQKRILRGVMNWKLRDLEEKPELARRCRSIIASTYQRAKIRFHKEKELRWRGKV